MRGVSRVGGVEAMQRPRRPSGEQGHEPVRDHREDHGDSPQDQPHEVRQPQQRAEEDGQA